MHVNVKKKNLAEDSTESTRRTDAPTEHLLKRWNMQARTHAGRQAHTHGMPPSIKPL